MMAQTSVTGADEQIFRLQRDIQALIGQQRSTQVTIRALSSVAVSLTVSETTLSTAVTALTEAVAAQREDSQAILERLLTLEEHVEFIRLVIESKVT